MNKITGVIKRKKTPVIVIDDDSNGDDDSYDTAGSNLDGIPKLVKKEYNSSDYKSDDGDDDISPHDDDAIEIEANANSGKLSLDTPHGRGLRVRKKRTDSKPLSSEFTGANVSNVRRNVGHF